MLTQRKTTGSIRAGAKTGSLSLQWQLNPPMARTAGLNPPNQLFAKGGPDLPLYEMQPKLPLSQRVYRPDT